MAPDTTENRRQRRDAVRSAGESCYYTGQDVKPTTHDVATIILVRKR